MTEDNVIIPKVDYFIVKGEIIDKNDQRFTELTSKYCKPINQNNEEREEKKDE